MKKWEDGSIEMMQQITPNTHSLKKKHLFNFVYCAKLHQKIDISWISPVQFHPKSTMHAPVFESVCSKECGIGEFKVRWVICRTQSVPDCHPFSQHFQDGAECCWTCVLCREEQYLYNETSCKSCHRGWWPNINKTG